MPITHTDKAGSDPRPDRAPPQSWPVGVQAWGLRNRSYRDFSGAEIEGGADQVYGVGSRQYAIGVTAALPLFRNADAPGAANWRTAVKKR